MSLVDDGSTDGSSGFATALADSQPERVSYFQHPNHANRGTSASRNLGLSKARGQYVIGLDSDDVFASDDALAEQVALLDAHPEVEMVYGPCQYWRSWDGSGADQVFPLAFRDEVVEPPRLLARMIESSADKPVSMTVRLKAIESVGGYDESIRDFGEDFILAAPLTQAFPAFASSRCWYRYRMHPESYSHRVAATGGKSAHERILLDWLERFLRDMHVRDRAVWQAFRRRALPLRHARWVRLGPIASDDTGWLLLRLRIAFQGWRRRLAGGRQAMIDVVPDSSAAPCGAGLWRASVHWTVIGSHSVSIHVGAPDGPLFLSANQSGSQQTRCWVSDRMRLFLQDAASPYPNELSATLAVVRVRVQMAESRPIQVGHRTKPARIPGVIIPPGFPAPPDMTEPARPSFHGFEQIPLREYAERAYLDYSMYVVLDRALPFLGDGLKPVQRRIIYAMSELGLASTAKPKKSARTIGDVIGKFHPHGDSACYGALVLMAQPFSYRYPLIEGQGNFGSTDDPSSFAAMRYTESKLTPIAEVLLGELEHGTVDWSPNFDGTMEEPSWLPARLPHVLLNGTTGIAVGMATDVPPHNLNEIVSACIRLIDDPDASVRDLCEHVRGPDYPTAAEIITSASDLLSMYETGLGSVRARATYTREGQNLVITAMPYQVSPSKIMEQIATQMRAKKLPWLEDLRDESDHQNAVRLVLVPRSNRVDYDALMGHLFATTDLEKSFRVNLNIIGLDGRPQVKNLKSLLVEWLVFRFETVRKRMRHRLEKVERRLHLLDGLLVAFLNLDEVIHIIRTQDDARAALIARFALSDDQADHILDTRLKQLARLEEMKIRGEQDELATERDKIQSVLDSPAKLKKQVKDELLADAKKFGDARRSPIVQRVAAQAISESELVPSEPVTIVLSEKGWIRAAKGHEVDASTLSYREGDSLAQAVRGRSTQQVAFLDSTGRAYSTLAHTLPSARGNGEPLTGRFTLPSGAKFVGAAVGDNDTRFLVASSFGYGFVTRFENFTGRQKAGKQLINCDVAAQILQPSPVTDPAKDWIVAVTSAGHLLAFPITELPELDKGKGNKLIQIPAAKLKSGEESVLAVASVRQGGELTIYCGQRHLTLGWRDLQAYEGTRASRGNSLPRGFQRVDWIDAT